MSYNAFIFSYPFGISDLLYIVFVNLTLSIFSINNPLSVSEAHRENMNKISVKKKKKRIKPKGKNRCTVLSVEVLIYKIGDYMMFLARCTKCWCFPWTLSIISPSCLSVAVCFSVLMDSHDSLPRPFFLHISIRDTCGTETKIAEKFVWSAFWTSL